MFLCKTCLGGGDSVIAIFLCKIANKKHSDNSETFVIFYFDVWPWPCLKVKKAYVLGHPWMSVNILYLCTRYDVCGCNTLRDMTICSFLWYLTFTCDLMKKLKVIHFDRVRASTISNHLAKTASKSVHSFGFNFVHWQTDRQTHTHTYRHTLRQIVMK